MPDCGERSTDADHFPLDRRELERRGLDPDDPAYGRGLCGAHHRSETARLQPGGWAAQSS
jgi:5-methylcytosine-specific restriction protein A